MQIKTRQGGNHRLLIRRDGKSSVFTVVHLNATAKAFGSVFPEPVVGC